jgi:hypothetical protein
MTKTPASNPVAHDSLQIATNRTLHTALTASIALHVEPSQNRNVERKTTTEIAIRDDSKKPLTRLQENFRDQRVSKAIS